MFYRKLPKAKNVIHSWLLRWFTILSVITIKLKKSKTAIVEVMPAVYICTRS